MPVAPTIEVGDATAALPAGAGSSSPSTSTPSRWCCSASSWPALPSAPWVGRPSSTASKSPRRQAVSVLKFMTPAQFWFQSFQNWQSEFLVVGAVALLGIRLRERASPESKPVAAPIRRPTALDSTAPRVAMVRVRSRGSACRRRVRPNPYRRWGSVSGHRDTALWALMKYWMAPWARAVDTCRESTVHSLTLWHRSLVEPGLAACSGRHSGGHSTVRCCTELDRPNQSRRPTWPASPYCTATNRRWAVIS